MIETIADLLTDIRDKGLNQIIIEEGDIKHRPTIGNIFEGLTRELLEKALFRGLGLKVVLNSFIYNDSGHISKEMDCMVVVGEGTPISFTNQFKYHISNVMCVIQVKKRLFANDIHDAYLNLRSVKEIAEPRDSEDFVYRLWRDAYKLLTLRDLPTEERLARFTDRENIIYHHLMMEAFFPSRIVFGYYGYKDEFGLREGFVKKLEEIGKNGFVNGYGPGSFPNLLVCGNNSIIRNTGMPFGVPLNFDKDFYWPLILTTNERPFFYLLNLIWTRIAYKFRLPTDKLFGSENFIRELHPLLSGKEKKVSEDQWGWEYYYHLTQKEDLDLPLSKRKWEPVQISDAQAITLMIISERGPINLIHDSEFREIILNKGFQFDTFITELINTKLVYVDEDLIYISATELSIVITPSGRVYAGENASGQMTEWQINELDTKSQSPI